mmetsp:Transcript_41937/g.69803  ORF Transcript_41937/g.69803 Transcript_41937/m.69803 type:complete len:83 (-) Transcript_41937:81-329(-)
MGKFAVYPPDPSFGQISAIIQCKERVDCSLLFGAWKLDEFFALHSSGASCILHMQTEVGVTRRTQISVSSSGIASQAYRYQV